MKNVKTGQLLKNVKLGQYLKDKYGYIGEVVFIHENSFEVQFKSLACIVYRQEDLDNGNINFYIG